MNLHNKKSCVDGRSGDLFPIAAWAFYRNVFGASGQLWSALAYCCPTKMCSWAAAEEEEVACKLLLALVVQHNIKHYVMIIHYESHKQLFMVNNISNYLFTYLWVNFSTVSNYWLLCAPTFTQQIEAATGNQLSCLTLSLHVNAVCPPVRLMLRCASISYSVRVLGIALESAHVMQYPNYGQGSGPGQMMRSNGSATFTHLPLDMFMFFLCTVYMRGFFLHTL